MVTNRQRKARQQPYFWPGDSSVGVCREMSPCTRESMVDMAAFVMRIISGM